MNNKDTMYNTLKFYAKAFYFISLTISFALIIYFTFNGIKTIPAFLSYVGVQVNKVIIIAIIIFLALIFAILSYLSTTYFHLWSLMKIQFYEDTHIQVLVLGNISNLMKSDSELREKIYGKKYK